MNLISEQRVPRPPERRRTGRRARARRRAGTHRGLQDSIVFGEEVRQAVANRSRAKTPGRSPGTRLRRRSSIASAPRPTISARVSPRRAPSLARQHERARRQRRRGCSGLARCQPCPPRRPLPHHDEAPVVRHRSHRLTVAPDVRIRTDAMATHVRIAV
jgi:hypothetical protein